ncbi:toxin-antitoxin system YwqK family antitoxin [Williamwhitmania taraxaci]|uniref:Antitoxin component YwqK of the YwqJK toxin-antitoxin module n=1 Tax=Williamwhitmania taraxaci TaxID=1640674 RepID=A0A1G6GQ84_9BACT|nr:toxin-antitoxin system YwqK family antitoxin [Williamwhitmania taraxaci]SDB84118.1 Antitoxin component YwqK of the YwqJK toxin-antitoxin module [Williamwhitmania taraxaci]
MKIYITTITVLLFSATITLGQNIPTNTNLRDEKGRKQGVWCKLYKNGEPAYTAKFKDDIPTDTLKRYTEKGTLKVVMIFDNTGKIATTTYLHPNGKRAAEGIFIGQQKDGIWKYYTPDTTILMIEQYAKGKLNGIRKRFYTTGEIMEELSFSNGIKNGVWTTYFPNGRYKYSGVYKEGKLNGEMKTFYSNGRLVSEGNYKNGLKEGEWQFYNENGDPTQKVVYRNGIGNNKDKLDRKQTEQLLELEKNIGKIEEPSAEKVMEQMGY